MPPAVAVEVAVATEVAVVATEVAAVATEVVAVAVVAPDLREKKARDAQDLKVAEAEALDPPELRVKKVRDVSALRELAAVREVLVVVTDPVDPDLKVKKVRDDPELRVAEAEAPDLPELRVKVLPRVAKKELSTVRERRETTITVSTASRARRESSGTLLIEETEPAEAEVFPRAATARATGAPLKMRPSKEKKPSLRTTQPPSKRVRLRMPSRRRKSLSFPKSENLLKTTSTLASSLSRSTSLPRRDQPLRMSVELTTT